MTLPAILNLYTIYRRPADYPNGYVVRRHEVHPGEARATGDVRFARTLEAARQLVPPGLTCIGRDQTDEPQIVETWL